MKLEKPKLHNLEEKKILDCLETKKFTNGLFKEKTEDDIVIKDITFAVFLKMWTLPR